MAERTGRALLTTSTGCAGPVVGAPALAVEGRFAQYLVGHSQHMREEVYRSSRARLKAYDEVTAIFRGSLYDLRRSVIAEDSSIRDSLLQISFFVRFFTAVCIALSDVHQAVQSAEPSLQDFARLMVSRSVVASKPPSDASWRINSMLRVLW